MQQFISASEWYGLFATIEANLDTGTYVVRAVPLRLVGWCSAEGGFQGLYQDVSSGLLKTLSGVAKDSDANRTVTHLGDLQLGEPCYYVRQRIEGIVCSRFENVLEATAKKSGDEKRVECATHASAVLHDLLRSGK